MRSVVRVVALVAVSATAVRSVEAQALQATLVQSGFSAPLYLCSPPGDVQRQFVVEQSGKIRIIKGGATLATPFLDLGTTGLNKIVWGGEQGLLGLAFHPSYATNGLFYVNYTKVGTGATVVERYHVSANPDVADSASGFQILTVAQPFANHNGGCIEFGLDGKLYIGMGDGGGGGGANSQAPQTLLGKMLRLDVDLPPPYVPSDNPFAGSSATAQEILHFGLRNPWRFSIDRLTGELYIADVGQSAREEVDVVSGLASLNFGWPCMEGTACAGGAGCTCNAPTLTLPVHEYTHSFGCAITGGFVYRGSAICGLAGTYFFADFCTTNIWSFRRVNGQVLDLQNRTTELEPAGAPTISNIAGFGQDAAGELYILDHADGEVYRIDLAGGGADCNGNGVADPCDIANGLEVDCNHDFVPDACQVASGAFADCDSDAVLDVCELASGTGHDVNQNGVLDECDCPSGAVPTSYCLGKLNSQFCLPTIASSGFPSATGATPFTVNGSNFINNKIGLLFYGYQTQQLPYQNGVLCVVAPLRRTPVQNSGGSPTGVNCSGTYTFDFGAWITSGVDPLLQVGQPFACQYWSRDPQDSYLSSFSNALQAAICQ